MAALANVKVRFLITKSSLVVVARRTALRPRGRIMLRGQSGADWSCLWQIVQIGLIVDELNAVNSTRWHPIQSLWSGKRDPGERSLRRWHETQLSRPINSACLDGLKCKNLE